MNCNMEKTINKSKFDFVKNFKLFLIAPLIILIAGIILTAVLGFNQSIEFTGGTMVNVYVGETLENQSVYDDSKLKIEQVLYQNGLKASVIQKNETDIGLCLSVRYQDKEGFSSVQMEELNIKVSNELFTAFGYDKEDSIQKNYVVGSQRIEASAGSDVLAESLTALLIASVLIAIYMLFRFGISSSLSAFLCVELDVLITLAMISVLRIELATNIVAVLVAVMAFSFLNKNLMFNTIKINSEAVLKNSEIANNSVKSVLYRMILINLFALLAFIALSLFGFSFATNFSVPAIIGIVSSFYSSVFLAPALWAFAFVRKNKKYKQNIDLENGVV